MSKLSGTIIYIGGFEMPDKNPAAHQVLNNSRIFRSLGYNIVFCGIDTSIKNDNYTAYDIIDGFDSYPYPYPNNSKQWIKYLSDFNHIKRIIDKYKDTKMIIAYNLHALPLLKTIKYCQKNKIKVVSNLTEWYENKFSLNPSKTIRWLDTLISMNLAQKKVDGMIAVSQYLKKYYSKYVSNIIVVPPLIDIHEPKWEKSIQHIETKRVEFIYSGGIERGNKKDKLCPIIESFYKIKDEFDFHFSIIGLTKKRLIDEFPEIEILIDKLGDKITFYGRVSHEISINKLKEADYCIFVREPSRKNNSGFPTKFVESWTSGINIIASKISDINNYFPKDNYSILMDNNNTSTIISSLKKALSHSTFELCQNRRNGLCNDNPFYYNNWIDTMKEFISNIIT